MISVEVDPLGQNALSEALQFLSETNMTSLLTGVMMEMESQTTRRLNSEKTDATGTPWKPWSKEYAATRKPHHSLLVNEGYLESSITSFVDGSYGYVGTNLVYAARQNRWRQFLGVSAENQADIDDIVYDFLARKL